MIIKSLKISEQERNSKGFAGHAYPLFYLICLLFIMPFTGCQDDKMSYAEDCEFALSLTANTQLNSQTRASGIDTLLPEPNINNFKVQVLNPGGKLLKEWERYSEVSNPIKIQTGTFTLKASHGEQHTGAFDAPYFEGSTEFGVKRSERTEVAVTCYLANVMVTTSYTDKFKEFFKDYSINIYSSGAPIVYTKDEKRTSFFEPGSLTVIANVTKQDGTNFSFAAAQIDKTKAKEYYRFKFDLAGAPGNEKLQISFDASTIASPIQIDISQGWIAGEPPTFLHSGFTNGQQFSNMEGEVSPNEISSLIMAPSRIKSCKLTTTSDLLIQAGWPAKEIDLVSIDTDTKAKLKTMGLKWTERLGGLNMAQINFTDVVPLLPGGASDITHSFTLTTTDDWGQTCIQPLAVSFITASPSFILHPHNDVWVKTTDINFDFSITKGKIEQIRLDYNNGKDDQWTPLTYSANPVSSEEYKLTAQVNFTSSNAKIRAIYGSGKSSEITFKVINPKLQIEQSGLPFAKRISLDLTETDGNFLFDNLIKEDIRVEASTNGQWEAKPFEIVKGSSGSDPIRFNISELKDNTQQLIRIVYNGGIGDANSNAIDIKTEKILQIPNAGLETWIQDLTLSRTSVNKGGRPGAGILGGIVLKPYETGDITVYQSSSPWATTNKKTMPTTVTTPNFWYMVPSVYFTPNGYVQKAAIIRSVSWDNNGSTPPDGNKWSAQTLNDLNPPTIRQHSAGKLFLGSYDCTHNGSASGLTSELYNYGYNFESRPIGIKFYYKYTAYGSDKGFIKAYLKDSEGTIIATLEQSLEVKSDYECKIINFNYNKLDKKAVAISILFASSDKCSEDQNIENNLIQTENKKMDAISTGSELYIDEVELIY